jgi:hypothetical protein
MTEEYIKKARLIHGNKYNYDKVVYTVAKSKIIINCPIEGHGDFEKEASAHISTQPRGCPECGKLTNKKGAIFIDRANKIHQNKYDYSLVKYIKSNENVIIICTYHGDFLQTPNNHLGDHGCPKCKTDKYEPMDYLNTFEEKHGDYYDYDKTIFKTQRENIIIKCPVHGFFEQKLSSHLQGRGCIQCGRKKMAIKNKQTKEEFIEKAKLIHGNKFDYNLVEYENCHKHIKIKCNKHKNIFEQSPRNHLKFALSCEYCLSESKMIKRDSEDD